MNSQSSPERDTHTSVNVKLLWLETDSFLGKLQGGEPKLSPLYYSRGNSSGSPPCTYKIMKT